MKQGVKISEPEINFESQHEGSVGYLTGACNYLWNKENYSDSDHKPFRNQRMLEFIP
jgi:hypothetical protein